MGHDSINIYIPTSQEGEKWGLFLHDIGKARTPAYTDYPQGPHPPGYIFNFKQGRVLQEHQVLYISEGEGIFESKESGVVIVETGSIIILSPGQWHRYRPNPETGWRESWVGFSGDMAERILQSEEFLKIKPVIKIGVHSRINNLYDRMLLECQQENPGYQQVVAGMVMQLMGLIQMHEKTRALKNSHIQSQIFQSRRIIEERYLEMLDPIEIANAVGMGYSNFRKNFKRLTGISPVQYIIHLRIREAKELLYNTDLNINELAEKAGFNSSYYFIRIFKEKVGMTPRTFRKKARGLDQ